MDREAFGGNRSERIRFFQKVAAAVSLTVIFGCVVFSMPADRLAAQAPYVMGALLLPDPSPASSPPATVVQAESDSLLSLLGFFCVLGILGLSSTRVLPGPRMDWIRRRPRPRRFGWYWGILIHYNVKPMS